MFPAQLFMNSFHICCCSYWRQGGGGYVMLFVCVTVCLYYGWSCTSASGECVAGTSCEMLLETSISSQQSPCLGCIQQNGENKWRAPCLNRMCSTTMKLRKSLVKPVTRQKTCNYNMLFGCSAWDDTYIGRRSENNIWRAGCNWLVYVDIHSVY